jgi:hypothetical protein
MFRLFGLSLRFETKLFIASFLIRLAARLEALLVKVKGRPWIHDRLQRASEALRTAARELTSMRALHTPPK